MRRLLKVIGAIPSCYDRCEGLLRVCSAAHRTRRIVTKLFLKLQGRLRINGQKLLVAVRSRFRRLHHHLAGQIGQILCLKRDSLEHRRANRIIRLLLAHILNHENAPDVTVLDRINHWQKAVVDR